MNLDTLQAMLREAMEVEVALRGYLVSERQEGRWAERRARVGPAGLANREMLEGMSRERHAPHTQTLAHKS